MYFIEGLEEVIVFSFGEDGKEKMGSLEVIPIV